MELTQGSETSAYQNLTPGKYPKEYTQYSTHGESLKSSNGKKVYKWKPMLRRTIGRPKNRWEDDIRNDIKKLKIKNWTNCIQDRKNWKLYAEKAETFKELKL
jgi:hypothetical protein